MNEWSDKRREHQLDLLPKATISIFDMREECRREVDMRCRVYADRVAKRAMNRTTADRRIAIMEAVVDLLDRLIADWEKRGELPR